MQIAFLSADSNDTALGELTRLYGNADPDQADMIVALGGDGFMLQIMHQFMTRDTPIYGMNRGTVGFLMNTYKAPNLRKRLEKAEPVKIHPLRMETTLITGEIITHLAINEVSLLRSGPQAAWLRLIINERVRLDRLVCDGAMVATPAGSTAYNYSAHGPIIPIHANILAITAVAAFRPRRWRGALIPMDAKVRFEVLSPEKRPVHASADTFKTGNIAAVEIAVEPKQYSTLLFDQGHGLEERLLSEQFL